MSTLVSTTPSTYKGRGSAITRRNTGGTSSEVNGGTTTSEQMRLEFIILVMGMTGSGKSSFIKLITGDEEVKIGHGVASQTSDIGVHRWTAPDGRICAFVDTPGFDDSNGMSDTEVLDKIATFLKGTYGKINGLIYCQRIDVRAGGLTIRNLRMIEKVCGPALRNAVIVTTRWDVVGNEKAIELERELKTGQRYFKPFCDAGARTFGHNNTRLSAWRVMYKLLNYSPTVLLMQDELEAGMTLEQTAAGAQLSADLDVVIKKHGAEIKKVQEEMEDAVKAKDRAWQKELNDELAKLSGEVARSAQGKENLKKRLLNPIVSSTGSERLMPPAAEGVTGAGQSLGHNGQSSLGTLGTLGTMTSEVGGAFVAGVIRGFRS